MAQNLHRTARGKIIDMNKLMNQHELEVAVSNVKINARGDELGPGGNIIKNVDPINDIPHSGIFAQPHAAPSSTNVATPVQKPVVATAPIKTESMVPVVNTPNALSQPLPELKDLDKLPKGKQ